MCSNNNNNNNDTLWVQKLKQSSEQKPVFVMDANCKLWQSGTKETINDIHYFDISKNFMSIKKNSRRSFQVHSDEAHAN